MLFSSSLPCRSSLRLFARSSLWSLSRTYSDSAQLPPLTEWRKTFPSFSVSRRERVFLKNLEAARAVSQAFLKPGSCHKEGDIVIEAFPGPGVLSRALLELPASSLRKLIVLEDDEGYLKYLQPLAEADPRLTVVPMSGHSWETYSHLEEHGLLKDVVAGNWEENSFPNLRFVAHLPHNVRGEQLIAQLFRCIPERSWLFQYGRVPMHILMSDYVWQRLTANIGTLKRCKLSVIGEAVADTTDALDPLVLAPYEDHFYPPAPVGRAAGLTRKPGQPMRAVTSIPYAEQVIQRGQTDQWDYVLRRLFVLKNTPLKKALDSLAPGARSLIDPLTSTSVPLAQRVNVTKKVRDLNVSDWALVLRAFDKWPFKPTDLMIDSIFSSD